MHPTIFQRILAKLNGDSTLLTLLGVSTLDATNPPCFRAQRSSPSKIPSVTVKEISFSATSMPCSDRAVDIVDALVDTERPSIQVDIWVSSEGGISPDNLPYPQTGEDADAIADRVAVLLVKNTKNRVQGTQKWSIVSGTQQYEIDTYLYHNVLRMEFEYFIIQGFVPE